MISFEKAHSNFAKSNMSSKEWDNIKSLMHHIANPYKHNAASLYQMSGLQEDDIQKWVITFQDKKEPPRLMHRNSLVPLFSVAFDAIDAKVENLTQDHREVIENIQKYRLRDILNYDNDER